MLLRDHPLMSYKGFPSWPPVWTWIDGLENKRPKGEIGFFRRVVQSNIQPSNRCFLFIDYEESSYIGDLTLDDSVFCDQTNNQTLAGLLQSSHCGDRWPRSVPKLCRSFYATNIHGSLSFSRSLAKRSISSFTFMS
jgi:hypothetical protein